MEALIFIFHLLLFTFLIPKIPFFTTAGIGRWKLIALFYIKIVAGIAYALFYKLPKYYPGSDTWRFYRLSVVEKQWLLKDPAAFTKDLFIYGYDKAGNVFEGKDSYWNDLKSNIPVKMMAVMNIFTNSSYFADIIIFNFLFLFGLVALYKFFRDYCKNKELLIIIGVFLLPSTLFWCSGIHKDGLILSAIGIIIYSFNKLLNDGRKRSLQIIIIVFCLVLIFGLRNYVAFALVPALISWWLSSKLFKSSWLPFVIIYTIGIFLFFGTSYIVPTLNFPAYIVQKQMEFGQLEGDSKVILHPLEPTVISFIQNLPSAIDMAFFRPHITEAKNLSYIPATLENLLFIALLVTALFRRNKKANISAYLLFCLFFSVSILLLSGYTITLSGAIVRYRSIVLPLLITPLLCFINFKSNKSGSI